MYKNGKNITIIDHNVNCVDNILCDISKTHPLTNEEEHQLWLAMQQGNQRAPDSGVICDVRGYFDWSRPCTAIRRILCRTLCTIVAVGLRVILSIIPCLSPTRRSRKISRKRKKNWTVARLGHPLRRGTR